MVNDTRKFAAERLRSVSIVGREALGEAGSAHAFSDFYHQAMMISWPMFFAATASVFLLLNCGFAGLYMLGEAPIAHQRPGNFLDLFFFSVETLATVGGNMYPQTTYGHSVATLEIFTGLCFLALITGLIFTRFSRPKARLVFSRNPVVTLHDAGKP